MQNLHIVKCSEYLAVIKQLLHNIINISIRFSNNFKFKFCHEFATIKELLESFKHVALSKIVFKKKGSFEKKIITDDEYSKIVEKQKIIFRLYNNLEILLHSYKSLTNKFDEENTRIYLQHI